MQHCVETHIQTTAFMQTNHEKYATPSLKYNIGLGDQTIIMSHNQLPICQNYFLGQIILKKCQHSTWSL